MRRRTHLRCFTNFIGAAVGAGSFLAGVAAKALSVLPHGDSAPLPSRRVLVFLCEGTGIVNNPNSPLRVAARASGLPFTVVPYPASFFPVPYDRSVADGIRTLVRLVLDAHAKDPDCELRVVGYSQGARVAGDGLVELCAIPSVARRLAGVLIADPRHPGSGIEVTLPGLAPGITMTGPRPAIGCPVLRIAAHGDPICDMPAPGRNIAGYFTQHSRYHVKRVEGRPLLDWVGAQLDRPADRTVWV